MEDTVGEKHTLTIFFCVNLFFEQKKLLLFLAQLDLNLVTKPLPNLNIQKQAFKITIKLKEK